MLIIAQAIGAQTIGGNVDRVMVGVPMPKGAKLLSVSGEVHMIGEEDQPTNQFMAWGMSGVVVPVPDPDTAIVFGALWDNVIVKSADPTTVAATSLLDWDWDTADTSVQIEPGEMNINDVLGMTEDQKEFLPPRLSWVSWAKSRQGGFVAGTPDDFLPSDFKTFRSQKKITADTASVAMIALSSPLLDETLLLAAHLTPPNEGAWYQLANMTDTLRDFAKINAGLVEAGAESPYANATSRIQDLIARDMLDESSTLYNSMSWTGLLTATFFMDFPGDSLPGTLDGR